jgi:hypothetical protein
MSKFEAKLYADSLGHCEFDGRTVHKLRQRRPTNDRLAPRESVHGCAERYPLTAKLHQGHATGSPDIKYGWMLGRPLIVMRGCWSNIVLNAFAPSEEKSGDSKDRFMRNLCSLFNKYPAA